MPYEDLTLDFDCLYEELQVFSDQLTAEYGEVVNNIFIERGDCLIEAYNLHKPEKTKMTFDCYLPDVISQEDRVKLLTSENNSIYVVNLNNEEGQIFSATIYDNEKGIHANTHMLNIKGEKRREIFSNLAYLLNINYSSIENDYNETSLNGFSLNSLMSTVDSTLEKNPDLNCELTSFDKINGITSQLRSNPKIKNGAWRTSYTIEELDKDDLWSTSQTKVKYDSEDVRSRVNYVISQLESAGIDFYEKDWRVTDRVSNKKESRTVVEHISQNVSLFETISHAYDSYCENTFDHPYILVGTNGSITTKSSFDGTQYYTKSPGGKRCVNNGADHQTTTISGELEHIKSDSAAQLIESYGVDSSLHVEVKAFAYDLHLFIKDLDDSPTVAISTTHYHSEAKNFKPVMPLLDSLQLHYVVEEQAIRPEKQDVSHLNYSLIMSSIDNFLLDHPNLRVSISSKNHNSGIKINKKIDDNKGSIKNSFEISSLYFDFTGDKENDFTVISDLEELGVDFTGIWSFRKKRVDEL